MVEKDWLKEFRKRKKDLLQCIVMSRTLKKGTYKISEAPEGFKIVVDSWIKTKDFEKLTRFVAKDNFILSSTDANAGMIYFYVVDTG